MVPAVRISVGTSAESYGKPARKFAIAARKPTFPVSAHDSTFAI